MAIKIDSKLTPKKLVPHIERVFELSGQKILSIEKSWKPEQGTPVFTVKGKYTSRGWTEWTQGFQYGSALLQFDAMGDEHFLEIGKRGTVKYMASHVSHVGVHDHGFNNVSTYGNLLRLMREGKIAHNEEEKNFYEIALKVSGAVQASRWTKLADGTGFIHSFNGPHSLFVDTIRSCRALAVAHQLGHVLMGEQDAKISLLQRVVEHALNTARYSIYFGEGRDAYDICGRTAHEAVFNTVSGVFRCPNSQQGYAPFTTWTRGLAWAICGFAEQLEFIRFIPWQDLETALSKNRWLRDYRSLSNKQKLQLTPKFESTIRRLATEPATKALNAFQAAAISTADFYLENSCADGVPMWDTGAPNLHRLPANYLNKASDPYNKFEPVDGSAAAIAAQGLIRLGNYLDAAGDKKAAVQYRQAGLSVARTLFSEPYLSIDPKHQGLLLHSVYHRPNGWDYIAPGQSVPNGESSMWGDYHLRELALLILREARGEHYLTFFDSTK
ncbi:MAG: glycoside hydrolase family 88 protein [Verrucomicrobiota bacterium]